MKKQSVLSTLCSPSLLIQFNWAEDNYNSIILNTNTYKWSSVCLYVCFGVQLRNERTDWVDFLHRVGQYIKINGVSPFRYFPQFQDGVLHSGVTTQSSSNGIIFWINYIKKTIYSWWLHPESSLHLEPYSNLPIYLFLTVNKYSECWWLLIFLKLSFVLQARTNLLIKVRNSSVQEDEVEKIILVRGGKVRVLWKGARSHRPSCGGCACASLKAESGRGCEVPSRVFVGGWWGEGSFWFLGEFVDGLTSRVQVISIMNKLQVIVLWIFLSEQNY